MTARRINHENRDRWTDPIWTSGNFSFNKMTESGCVIPQPRIMRSFHALVFGLGSLHKSTPQDPSLFGRRTAITRAICPLAFDTDRTSVCILNLYHVHRLKGRPSIFYTDKNSLEWTSCAKYGLILPQGSFLIGSLHRLQEWPCGICDERIGMPFYSQHDIPLGNIRRGETNVVVFIHSNKGDKATSGLIDLAYLWSSVTTVFLENPRLRICGDDDAIRSNKDNYSCRSKIGTAQTKRKPQRRHILGGSRFDPRDHPIIIETFPTKEYGAGRTNVMTRQVTRF
jgi:hypothetical protein